MDNDKIKIKIRFISYIFWGLGQSRIVDQYLNIQSIDQSLKGVARCTQQLPEVPKMPFIKKK